MLCLNCNKNIAQVKSPYGILPCKLCVNKSKKYKAGMAIELTTDAIREDRNKYRTDIEQRYDGFTPNLNYIKKYGTKGFSPEELKKAKARTGTFYRDSHEKYDPKSV